MPSEVETEIKAWPPEKKAQAAQWLVEKKLDALRHELPPAVFVEYCGAIRLLLEPLEVLANRE